MSDLKLSDMLKISVTTETIATAEKAVKDILDCYGVDTPLYIGVDADTVRVLEEILTHALKIRAAIRQYKEGKT